MPKLTSSSYIASLMQVHQLHFKKGLGQNFLIDANITANIVAGAGVEADDGVLEIGAGAGALTEELLGLAKKVVAVEIDPRLWGLLENNFADNPAFSLIKGDVLSLDLAKVIAEEFKDCARVLVVANLPYYITTPIIMQLLEQRLPIDSITIMVQKEVAERLAAHPNSKAYGALTVSAQFYAEIKQLFVVGKHCFMPSPAVDSAVIQLNIRPHGLDLRSDEVFFQTVKAAFNQRRKTIVNALTHNLHLDKEQLLSGLAELAISPQSRAENLSAEEFGKLSNLIAELL